MKPSSSGYWPTVALSLIALAPSLINFTALGLLSPSIGQSLSVSPADLAWVGLLSNAALPLGYVVAADLLQRIPQRHLVLIGLGWFTFFSVLAAIAPSLPVLIVAHIGQGFCAGVLNNAVIPSLLGGFPPSRLPTTITILGIGLFGASTVGPLIGGVVEQTGTWRLLFGINAVLGVAAIPLALQVVAAQPAPNPRAPADISGLVLAGSGIMLLFIGVGELKYHVLATPEVLVPMMLGLTILVAFFAVEWVQPDPLLSVRGLTRPKTLGAATVSWVGAFAFGGLSGVVMQFLLQVRGLGAQDAGFLLWPAPVAALIGSILVGLIFSKPRLVTVVSVTGLLITGVAALLLIQLTTFTGDPRVMLVAAVMGFGASTSIVPAMMVAAVSGHGDISRALALITLIRYSFQAGSGQVLTYFIGVWQTSHQAHLTWQAGINQVFGAPGELFATSIQARTASAISQQLQRTGLVLGMNDAARLLVLVVVLGAAISVLLFALRATPAHD